MKNKRLKEKGNNTYIRDRTMREEREREIGEGRNM